MNEWMVAFGRVTGVFVQGGMNLEVRLLISGLEPLT